MRGLEQNRVREADDFGVRSGQDGERIGRPHEGAAQPDERAIMKALLVAIEVGAILGVVAAILAAHFVTVW
jgi:hypothetical protein